ncbi:MAG: Ig-like domain-containing protein, partial [Arcobacteraceae bacterium]
MKSVGIVQNLDGKFYALEANGNIKVLEIGDTISQGDKIFGDSTNMYTNTVNILFNDGHTLTIAGVDNAVFDTSTNESSFGNEEMAFVPKNLWTNGNTEENISDDVVADSENKNDITEEETAAGEESPTSTDNGVFSFAQRDGASVDTQSELRENQLDTTNSYDLLESVESNNITNQENIILDTIAPSFATFSITDDAGNTTGTISNGTLTDDNTPTISGNTEPNSTVNIYDGTTLIGTTTSDGNGDYTFTPTTPLGDGSHTISVTVTDNAGNTLATTPITFNIDTTVPNNPTITNIIDTNGDYTNVIMHGTGEAGATITLYSQQGSTTAGNNTGSNIYIPIASVVVATNGTWSIDISNIPDVPINDNEFFYVTQTDQSGNISTPSDLVHYWHGDWVNSNMENNDDYIMAGNGNDAVTINVNDTNDYMVIDGGNGNDTAIFKGNMADYSIATNSEGHIIVTHSSTNTDNDTNGIGDQIELRNVETIKFADGTYDVTKDTFIPTVSIVTTIVTEDNAQIIGTAQDTDGTISLASYSANNGTVTLDTNGNIIYTPNSNYSGSDNVTFTVVDDKGATVTQTINLTISAVADSPTVNIHIGNATAIQTTTVSSASLDLGKLSAYLNGQNN